jgi:hypothetical protein
MFCRAVQRVLDEVLAKPARRCLVRPGAFVLDASFASEAFADSYLASFLQTRDEPVDARIGVLSASDTDLSDLVPYPADQARTRVTEACFVSWYPGFAPMLYVLDRKAGRGFIWFANGIAPEWELSRPACPLLHAMTADTPYTIAHGGAVSWNGRCMLLAGRGKAGKTTAALACARAGWDYAGDDYFFANTLTGQINPLYASARMRLDMAAAFSEMMSASKGRSYDDGDARHELRLSRILDSKKFAGGNLVAILMLRRRGAKYPEFAPASRTEAFNALVVTTRFGLPGPLTWIVEKLSRLVALAPAFFVDTGETPEAIPDAFRAFLERIP